jgi:pyridoxal phosphate enzyme (YggS family)
MADIVATITANLHRVSRRIDEAVTRANRSRDDITLVAVSKTHPPEAVEAAVAAGVADLGENRVQEGSSKRPQVTRAARWHLIGPLQRNKAGPALATFDVVHTLDRPELVHRLHTLLERDWPDRRLQVLVEVNLGHEEQKAGVPPEEAGELIRLARGSDRLDVLGLMAIPPLADDAELSRPYFVKLRCLRDALQDHLGIALPHLSMGMSHDFEVAIAEGATMIRVGTAIFGPRGSWT